MKDHASNKLSITAWNVPAGDETANISGVTLYYISNTSSDKVLKCTMSISTVARV